MKNLYAIFYAKVIKPNHVAPPREFTVNQLAFSKKYNFKEKAVLPVYYQHPTKSVLHGIRHGSCHMSHIR